VNSALLFVYGTLRRRFPRHSLLQSLGASYVSKGRICGELFDLGDYPGAVKRVFTAQHANPQRPEAGMVIGTGGTKSEPPSYREHPRSTVRGEVFRLSNPQRALRTLDGYEGACAVDGLYKRECTEVTLEDGSRATAWVYWLNRTPTGMRRIASGDYARK
jgi:gamma-glutamylcyclotransferase (GGCT)/AIG2-like uncharacterized protein YtfP